MSQEKPPQVHRIRRASLMVAVLVAATGALGVSPPQTPNPAGSASPATKARGIAPGPKDQIVVLGPVDSPALYQLVHGRPVVDGGALVESARAMGGGRREIAAGLERARMVGCDLAATGPLDARQRQLIDVALQMGVPIVLEDVDAPAMSDLIGIGFDADVLVARGEDGGRRTRITLFEEDLSRSELSLRTERLLDAGAAKSRGWNGNSPPIWGYREYDVDFFYSSFASVTYRIELFASHNPHKKLARIHCLGAGFPGKMYVDQQMHRGWYTERVRAEFGPGDSSTGIKFGEQGGESWGPQAANNGSSVDWSNTVSMNLQIGADSNGPNGSGSVGYSKTEGGSYPVNDFKLSAKTTGGSASNLRVDCSLRLATLPPGDYGPFEPNNKYETPEDLYYDAIFSVGVKKLPSLATGNFAFKAFGVWETSGDRDDSSSFVLRLERDVVDAWLETGLFTNTFYYKRQPYGATKTFTLDWGTVTDAEPGFAGEWDGQDHDFALESVSKKGFEGTLTSWIDGVATKRLVEAELKNGKLKGSIYTKKKVDGTFTLKLDDDQMEVAGTIKWKNGGKETFVGIRYGDV